MTNFSKTSRDSAYSQPRESRHPLDKMVDAAEMLLDVELDLNIEITDEAGSLPEIEVE